MVWFYFPARELGGLPTDNRWLMTMAWRTIGFQIARRKKLHWNKNPIILGTFGLYVCAHIHDMACHKVLQPNGLGSRTTNWWVVMSDWNHCLQARIKIVCFHPTIFCFLIIFLDKRHELASLCSPHILNEWLGRTHSYLKQMLNPQIGAPNDTL